MSESSPRHTSNIDHGLCVWPNGSLTSAPSGLFLRTLPADVRTLTSWLAEKPSNLLTIVVAQPQWDYRLVKTLRLMSRTSYIIVWHADATEDPAARIKAFEAGANMVTFHDKHLQEALRLITSIRGTGTITCPWCGLSGLSTRELWHHQPLYHIYEPDLNAAQCPACARPTSRLTRHINLYHGPHQLHDHCTGVFALAIVRRAVDGKFLMVQERYSEGYWVPGGGVDPGESLSQGAVREVREEAGVDIQVTGILKIEAAHQGTWRRIIFLADPLPPPQRDSPDTAAGYVACKTLPDVESAGACWVIPEQLSGLPLRSPSEVRWIPWVARGAQVTPLQRDAVPDLERVFPDYEL